MELYFWLILGFLSFLCLFVVLASFLMARSLYHPRTFTIAETREKEMIRSPGLIEDYETWPETRYTIKSRYGYDLAVHHITPSVSSGKFVVICHGYSYTYHGALKYARMMRELGFDIIMFDERFHGMSGGKNCTMGYFEKFDLYDVITDTFDRYGKDIFLGTYGESMGGAMVVMEQSFDKRVRFVAADCAFASLKLLLAYQIKRKTGMPKYPFLWITALIFRIVTKARLFAIEPAAALKDVTVPLFLAHGEKDVFIPPIHSRILYDACKTKKMLYIAGNDAQHTDASRYNPEEYRRKLKDFCFNMVEIPQI